jgi:hypothetical protein
MQMEIGVFIISSRRLPDPDSVPFISRRRDNLELSPSYSRIELKLEKETNLGNVLATHITPDGEHALLASTSKIAKVALANGKVVANVGPQIQVDRIHALGKSGPFLLWSSEKRATMRIWDGEGFTVDVIKEPPSPVKDRGRIDKYPIAISPDEKTALDIYRPFDANDGWLCVWDLTRREAVKMLPGYKDACAITYLGDGAGYVVGYHSGRIEVRDLAHKVVETIVMATDNVLSAPFHGGPRELAASRDGKLVGAFYKWGEVVLFQRGGRPLQPKSTVPEFDPALGTRWIYKGKTNDPEDEWIVDVAAVEAIRTEQCLRLDRYFRSKQRLQFQIESCFVAYRPEGLFWVGTVGRDGRFADILDPPVLLLPVDRKKNNLVTKAKIWDVGREFRLRTTEATVNVPFRDNVATVRVDHQKGGAETDSIWFAKSLGIVKWQSVSRGREMVLELREIKAEKSSGK